MRPEAVLPNMGWNGSSPDLTRKARPDVPGAGLLRLRRRGRTTVPVPLFQRSTPSRSLTATAAAMVNRSLPPVVARRTVIWRGSGIRAPSGSMVTCPAGECRSRQQVLDQFVMHAAEHDRPVDLAEDVLSVGPRGRALGKA
jgi:hypothetical protein